MTWTAPPVTRADGEFAGGERATLDGFLDWYRGTLLDKCDDAVPASAEADYAAYLRELDLARAAAAGQELGQTFVHERHQTEMNVRWVYVHMIEEYARHVGHADPIRECIDGRTGS